MAYKTVLVDDEPLAIQRLERMLAAHDDTIEIVGSAQSGSEAVALIDTLRPDLVFLDIQMPELTGFDVLDHIAYTPLVIFSTAYDEYALKAFEVNSIDYLLKPVDPQRLKQAIDKLGRLTDATAADLRGRIEKLLATAPAGGTERIQVRLGDRIKLIPVSDIVFFRASEKYVEVCAGGKTYLITKSLSQLEEALPDGFVRVHRSVVLNLEYVDEFAKDFDGGYVARMKDAGRTELPVSRRYRSRLDLG